MLLSQAERARLGLFALGRLRVRSAREAPDSPETALLDLYLKIASRVLQSIGDALVATQPADSVRPQLEELQALAERLRAAGAALQDARAQMDAVAGQLRSAFDLAAHATVAGLTAFARQEVHSPWYLRLEGTLATLRANLSLRSSACRHAIRLAVCVALGDALGSGLELHRSYWLPMTVAIVLKPDFASTFTRGVLRLAGTFAGLICATVLFHVLPAAPAAQVGAIAALMFVLRCWGPANYGLFVTAVTGMIVLLIAMAGVSPKEVIAARGLNTAIGGAIALAAYSLWPTRERTRVQDAMAQMLDAYREYFHAIRERYHRVRWVLRRRFGSRPSGRPAGAFDPGGLFRPLARRAWHYAGNRGGSQRPVGQLAQPDLRNYGAGGGPARQPSRAAARSVPALCQQRGVDPAFPCGSVARLAFEARRAARLARGSSRAGAFRRPRHGALRAECGDGPLDQQLKHAARRVAEMAGEGAKSHYTSLILTVYKRLATLPIGSL
jgi:hypothetical protein